MKENSDTKIILKIALGFILFTYMFIIPWIYGWYKILF